MAYESARRLARFLAIVLSANLVGAVLITAYTVAKEFAPRSRESVWMQVPSLRTLGVIAAVVFASTFVLAIVVFCFWLHRVVGNMPILGSPDPRWGAGDAVFRCFVPVLNFVHPLFGVLDVWRGSDPSRRRLDATARKAVPVPRLLIGWWLLWLLALLGGNPTDLTGMAGATLDAMHGAVFVSATVLAIVVVSILTARQDRKRELITSGQLT